MASTNKIEAIYQILVNSGTISALVGTRIYPGIKPQNAPNPCIVYSQLSEIRAQTKDVAILEGYRVAVEIYADFDAPGGGYSKVQEIGNACKSVLDYYQGTPTVDIGSVFIRCVDQSDADFFEDVEAFKVTQDYEIKII